MTTVTGTMDKHTHDQQPTGYVTAWSGDLNPDLPTRVLPLAELSMPTIRKFSTPSLTIMQAVLQGLRRL